ncbi:Glycosyltransferase family 9 protein [Azospirillaceae bacterium]
MRRKFLALKVLFITSNSLGDATLSTGLLSYLVETRADAQFTVVCGPIPAPLFKTTPRLDQLIELRKQKHSAHWFSLWRRCVGIRWNLVVDLRNSIVSRALCAQRVAVLPRPIRGQHRVRQIAATLRLPETPAPRLWLTSEDHNDAEALIPSGAPVLALAPASNWRGKTWRPERFAELARRLTDGPDALLPSARIAILAASGERPQTQSVINALDPSRVIDLVGRTNPRQAGACLARCALFVGNDSGLMHIAAAVGAPTLGLFGPSPMDYYAPWGPRAITASTEIPYAALVGAPDFDHRNTDTLMDTLSVESVLKSARCLLEIV